MTAFLRLTLRFAVVWLAASHALALAFGAGIEGQSDGVQPPVGARVKVACLGDSVTFGARIDDPARHAYPARLGAHLGEGYEVRAFGASGRTLRGGADLPYISEPVFQSALKWRPDVAIIVLGANDTVLSEKRPNWVEGHDFSADLKALVEELRGANGAIQVFVAAPPPILPLTPGIGKARLKELDPRVPRLAEIGAQVRTFARAERGVEFIDLMRVLRPEHSVDGVHPNPFGADRIGLRVAAALRMREPEESSTQAPLIQDGAVGEEVGQASGLGRTDFFGFRRVDFKLRVGEAERIDCVLVRPERSADGQPWVWRMRFFGHQPALDLELLARGYHLAYVDIANLYGAPPAVRRMKRFYAFCVGLGLSEKPVLEGMSRGGLPAVEFAKAAPQLVSAVYLDNPVCDIRSWPGGRSGKRSDADWSRALRAWGITEPDAWRFEGGPLLGLEPAAAAGVPFFLVLGGADEVVPATQNGERLVDRYRGLGGTVQVWRKPGAGHHPHGLVPVDPLLRAVLRSAGGDVAESSPSTTAQGSVEYRSGAGWGRGTNWFDAAQSLVDLAQGTGPVDVVFLGDSITQGLTGHGRRLTEDGGSRPFDRQFGATGAVSLGLSGDRTEHLLHRITAGALKPFMPRVVVLQIGVNNVNAAGHTGPETFAGIVAVIAALQEELPDARIVVCGPFPGGTDPNGRVRATLGEVRASIMGRDFADGVKVLDLWPLFVAGDGSLLPTMSRDGIHITQAGVAAWMRAIAPAVFD